MDPPQIIHPFCWVGCVASLLVADGGRVVGCFYLCVCVVDLGLFLGMISMMHLSTLMRTYSKKWPAVGIF